MLRDPFIPRGEKYAAVVLIMESAKEMQQFAKALPATVDLPTTHEHYIEHRVETRGERPVTVIEVGVRPKTTVHPLATSSAPAEPDSLNAMDDATLEVEAAAAGVDMAAYARLKSRAARVKAIREARQQQPAAV